MDGIKIWPTCDTVFARPTEGHQLTDLEDGLYIFAMDLDNVVFPSSYYYAGVEDGRLCEVHVKFPLSVFLPFMEEMTFEEFARLFKIVASRPLNRFESWSEAIIAALSPEVKQKQLYLK